MFDVKPLHALTRDEVRDLATHAADRGERLEEANPFGPADLNHVLFTTAFARRADELLRADAAVS